LVFRDNEIDGEVLPKLTSEDLREIGVAAVGHRRKLLDAIAALGASASAADVSTPPAETTATLAPKGYAERRQLTVMFCDLVGSTALSARLDPEDLREVIVAYHHAVADIVRSFDGFVAKYMGDGVLVYFGYPRAHEDDAERAVRAGLGLIDAVGSDLMGHSSWLFPAGEWRAFGIAAFLCYATAWLAEFRPSPCEMTALRSA
jgi:hypothetical protein